MFTKPVVALNSRKDEKMECLATCRKKSNASHNGTQEDSHLGLRTAQQEMTHMPPQAKHTAAKKPTVE